MPNFFDKYPYTDFHELNLDWILGKIKYLDTEFNIIRSQLSPIDMTFKTVADMQNEKNLTPGQLIATLGYYETGDGGSAFYYISDELPNTYTILNTDSGHTASLIYDDTLNILSIGAERNKDITDYLQFAINTVNTVLIPAGSFLINTVNISASNKRIIGTGFRTTILKPVENHSDQPIFNMSNILSQLRYINIEDLSIDNTYYSQDESFDCFYIASVLPNSVNAIADFFLKRLYIRGFDHGVNIVAPFDPLNPTKYFIQYFRIEECQFSYCNYNICAINTYYMQILNSYLQFPGTCNVQVTSASNYLKICNTTMNLRDDEAPTGNIIIKDSRFANITDDQLQSTDNLDSIILDNVTQFSVDNNQFVQGRNGIVCQNANSGRISNNNFYSVTKIVDFNASSMLVISNNLTDSPADYTGWNNSKSNFETGLLAERITSAYAGQLPAEGSAAALTLTGQNLILKVDSNVIKTSTGNKGILIHTFDSTVPAGEVINMYVKSNGSTIATYKITGDGSRCTRTLSTYINNNADLTVEVESNSTSARFNGGTLTFINCNKY